MHTIVILKIILVGSSKLQTSGTLQVFKDLENSRREPSDYDIPISLHQGPKGPIFTVCFQRCFIALYGIVITVINMLSRQTEL